MDEKDVIKHLLIYLIKEARGRARIETCSIRTKSEEKEVKDFLTGKGIGDTIINNIEWARNKEDIRAAVYWNQGRKIKELVIEAKGGDVFYNFYTLLGQFICSKRSPSTYYWFGFGLPISWRPKVRRYLRNAKIKPIIYDLIQRYTKKGQGLYFYWVDEKGGVDKETWRQTLTRPD